jgi:hypothetical protein
MKRLIIALAISLMLAGVAIATDKLCAPAWDTISGQQYQVTIDGTEYRLDFSPGYVGPCPQGDVWFYVDDSLAANWWYTSTESTISVSDPDTRATVLWFFYAGDNLVLIPADTIILERSEDD